MRFVYTFLKKNPKKIAVFVDEAAYVLPQFRGRKNDASENVSKL